MSITVRRAERDDVAYLTGVLGHPDVLPYLAASRTGSEDEVAAAVERSLAEPDAFGIVVIELGGERIGTATWELINRRSRIAAVGGFAIDQAYRGRRVGVEAAQVLQRHLIRELGFHRLQMEVYAFNERALRHAERAGWVREGVRRLAYRRNDEWVDSVLFGLVEEDLAP